MKLSSLGNCPIPVVNNNGKSNSSKSVDESLLKFRCPPVEDWKAWREDETWRRMAQSMTPQEYRQVIQTLSYLDYRASLTGQGGILKRMAAAEEARLKKLETDVTEEEFKKYEQIEFHEANHQPEIMDLYFKLGSDATIEYCNRNIDTCIRCREIRNGAQEEKLRLLGGVTEKQMRGADDSYNKKYYSNNQQQQQMKEKAELEQDIKAKEILQRS